MRRLNLLIILLYSLFGTQSVSAQCLTTSTPTKDCTYGDAINAFTLNGIASTGSSNSGSGYANCANFGGHSSYTSPVWTMTAGLSYSFSANVGVSPYPQGFAIWIDLNNNGQYDATEILYSGGAAYSHTSTITIPSTATIANGIRMRITCAWNATPTGSDACNSNLGSGYGETEDYYVNILSPCAASFTAQPTDKNVCSGTNTTFTVTATNANSYQWQVSTNGGTTWTNVTNAGVYSGATTVALAITGTLMSMNNYQYRCVATNTAGACSVNSTPAKLSVAETPFIASFTNGAACTGTSTSVSAVPSSGASVRWYDQLSGGSLLGTGNTLNIASAPAANTTYYADPVLPTSPTSLSVQLAATNGQQSCFMDIKALKNIKMTDISWVPSATATYNVSIYFKTGTAVGFETNSGAWTLIGSATGVSATANTPNKLTLSSAQTLAANGTYAIYVVSTGTSPSSIRYQTVSTLGGIEAQNTDIQLITAKGMAGQFTGTLFSPRHLSCIVWYEPVVCVAPSRTPVQLIVNAPPVATTHPANKSGCEGDNVSFVAAFNGASSYQWEVSDNGGTSWTNVSTGSGYGGATSTTLTITGITAAMNNYQYRCKGTCTSTTISNAATLTVNMPPAVVTNPSNTTDCIGSNVTLSVDATGSGTLSYQWEASIDGGANWGNISNGGFYANATTSVLSINGIATSLNNNQYRCVVTGVCPPAATSAAATLTVNTPPAITTQPANQDNCPGTNATFSCVVTGAGLTYQWQELISTTWSNLSNGGMYSGTDANTLVISNVSSVLNGRKYRCVLSGTCTPPDTTNEATLNIGAVPTVSAASNSPVCAGDELKFTANGATTGVTYSWSGPLSYSSAVQNPTISSPVTGHTGSFIVTATLTSSGCSVKDTVPVTVKIRPDVPTVSSNSPVCTKYDINLSATSTPGSTYDWTGPSNYSSTQQNPVRTPAALHMSGYYKVTATIAGCTSAPDSTMVTVIPAPEVGAYPSPGNVICAGDSIIFIGIANNTGTGPVYQWAKNGIDIPGANTLKYSSIMLAHGDIITLKMTPGSGVTCNAQLESVPIPMTVNPYLSPAVSISADPSGPVWEGLLVTFTADARDAGNKPGYQWKRNGTDVDGATGATWAATTFNDNDIITCNVTSNYMCPQVPSVESSPFTISVLTSVKNIGEKADVVLFPNPNKGSFIVKGRVDASSVQLEVLNAVGQVVYRNEVQTPGGELMQEIAAGAIADGIYVLRITGGSEQSSVRFKVIN